MKLFKKIFGLDHFKLGFSVPRYLIDEIIRDMADCVIVAGNRGKIEFANAGALRLLGYKLDALVGKPMAALISEKFSFQKEDFASGRLRSWEGLWKTAQGREISVSVSCTPARTHSGKISHFVYVAKDISNLKKSEETLVVAYRKLNETRERLLESEKMAVVGKLAGGIAHEIRNPLAIIMQGAYLLAVNAPADNKDLQETVVMIKDAVKRANDIIARLLEYSRLQKIDAAPVDVRTAIEDGLLFSDDKFSGKKIIINKLWEDNAIFIDADKNALSQVFAGLAANASEAMPEGGALIIKVDKNGNFCRIDFSDTGTGIPEKDLPHIFEPFFTTKFAGKNAGLGLALAQLIIERHKGTISIISAPGKGTTVTILIPLLSNPNKS
jgi:PAS domain S-box-containing protein